MPDTGTAVRVAKSIVEMSPHLPASFNNNPFLYANALTSVMSIACLGLVVCGWMTRDIWRDRSNFHPKTLLFQYRAMIALVGLAACVRSMPEVFYLQAYGDPDVSIQTQATITTIKRMMDSVSIWIVLGWMSILVVSYPHICISLRSGYSKQVQVDTLSAWPRIARPFLGFMCIVLISSAFAYSKVYGN